MKEYIFNALSEEIERKLDIVMEDENLVVFKPYEIKWVEEKEFINNFMIWLKTLGVFIQAFVD